VAEPLSESIPGTEGVGKAIERKGDRHAIGLVQLNVLGVPTPGFHGEIVVELEWLRESDTVRVIDALRDAVRHARRFPDQRWVCQPA
jgi:hypothetical protein